MPCGSHLSYTKYLILQLKIIVKVYRVFPSNCEKPAFSRALQFHQTCTGDSRELITPFMQDGTYPSRNFATFGPSELQPPFTGDYNFSHNKNYFTFQHRAGVSPYTSFYKLAETCVFIKQSPPSLLCQL